MAFYPSDAPVPAELRRQEFLLRMLRATDVALDYDAVIASRDSLLVRSAGRWPREGFTIEENLADLRRHEHDHHDRASFTFTVMNPAASECLGCIYVKPLTRLLQQFEAGAEAIAAVPAHAASVTFWVRPTYTAIDLDRRLLAALLTWLKSEWAFSQALFMANKNELRHLQLFQDAGLRQRYALTTPNEPYLFYVYG